MAYDARLLARHPDLLAERHNYTATADPTVNDDENDYYGVGSVWVNRLTNTVFICCDPTNGAAVWSEVGATEAVESVIDPTANDDIDAGYPTGTTWINQTTNSFFISVDSTTGAAIWNEVPHHNFNGAAAPTANDDVTAGYDIGSTWIYGTTLYTCVIATAAAAVWIEVNTSHNAAVDPTANDDINDGFVRGSTWINTTNSTIWHCIDNSVGAAVWQISVKVHSTNADPTVNADIDQGYMVGSTWTNTTTGAVFICTDNTNGAAIWVEVATSHSTNADPTVNDDIDAGYTVGTTWTNTATGSVFVCTDNTDGAAVWAEQAATTSTIQKATATIPYNDADGKVTLLTMTANGFIRFVGKVVTTAYDAGTVTVGEEGDEANLMTAELVDAQGATHDTYTPNKYYASGSVIKAFITPGAATQGTFTLILEYVTV
ncbi:MAG: hypothetical protein PHN44_10455 [Candidatus Marinimicrobia bacterium]|nr:hypothetical protein [Candidatus Neomarinimicrobiota bacterium]